MKPVPEQPGDGDRGLLQGAVPGQGVGGEAGGLVLADAGDDGAVPQGEHVARLAGARAPVKEGVGFLGLRDELDELGGEV